jgi:hypothetical protein
MCILIILYRSLYRFQHQCLRVRECFQWDYSSNAKLNLGLYLYLNLFEAFFDYWDFSFVFIEPARMICCWFFTLSLSLFWCRVWFLFLFLYFLLLWCRILFLFLFLCLFLLLSLFLFFILFLFSLLHLILI